MQRQKAAREIKARAARAWAAQAEEAA